MMFEDIKIEYTKLDALRNKLNDILFLCKQYVALNPKEFYDSTGISLREIENSILYLRSNILIMGNKEKIIEMQNRLQKAIKWATIKHVSLTSQQLQGKKISLSNGQNIIVEEYEVPYIDGLFEKIADIQTYYKNNLSYLPEYMRFKKFENLDYYEYLQQLNLLVEDYSRKISAKESRKIFR